MSNSFMEWLFSGKGPTIIAGAMGGVVRWITLQQGTWEGISSIVVGAICAVYLTPLVLPALTPVIGSFVGDEANRAGFSGFIIGLSGITVAGFFIDFFKAWSRKNLNDDEANKG